MHAKPTCQYATPTSTRASTTVQISTRELMLSIAVDVSRMSVSIVLD